MLSAMSQYPGLGQDVANGAVVAAVLHLLHGRSPPVLPVQYLSTQTLIQ